MSEDNAGGPLLSRKVLALPETGKVWLTSDTHFFHANIIGYCKRPFADVAEMNATMAERWNKRVRPEDTVYHLGDFALTKVEIFAEFRKQLQGNIILIRGNHDRFGKSRGGDLGMTVVETDAELKVGDRTFVLGHRPQFEPLAPNEIRLCGHVHEHWLVRKGVLNVGVDLWDFRPISFDEALAAHAQYS